MTGRGATRDPRRSGSPMNDFAELARDRLGARRRLGPGSRRWPAGALSGAQPENRALSRRRGHGPLGNPPVTPTRQTPSRPASPRRSPAAPDTTSTKLPCSGRREGGLYFTLRALDLSLRAADVQAAVAHRYDTPPGHRRAAGFASIRKMAMCAVPRRSTRSQKYQSDGGPGVADIGKRILVGVGHRGPSHALRSERAHAGLAFNVPQSRVAPTRNRRRTTSLPLWSVHRAGRLLHDVASAAR